MTAPPAFYVPDVFERQMQFMKHMGYLVNERPGLTCETSGWERKVVKTAMDLQVATANLHKTLSADSVAAVLLEAVTLIHNTAGLLNNIGVGDRAKLAYQLVEDALAHNDPRPDLLPIVLDKEIS